MLPSVFSRSLQESLETSHFLLQLLQECENKCMHKYAL